MTWLVQAAEGAPVACLIQAAAPVPVACLVQAAASVTEMLQAAVAALGSLS